MAYLRSDGNQTIYKTDYVLTADVEAGTIIPVGAMVGVCEVGGSNGDTVALSLTGKWEEVTADTFAVGDKVYIEPDGTLTTAADDGNGTSYTFVGTCVEAATGIVTFELGR